MKRRVFSAATLHQTSEGVWEIWVCDRDVCRKLGVPRFGASVSLPHLMKAFLKSNVGHTWNRRHALGDGGGLFIANPKVAANEVTWTRT